MNSLLFALLLSKAVLIVIVPVGLLLSVCGLFYLINKLPP